MACRAPVDSSLRHNFSGIKLIIACSLRHHISNASDHFIDSAGNQTQMWPGPPTDRILSDQIDHNTWYDFEKLLESFQEM